ncbi:MAG TPA: TIGR00730 family Rossman fold protein [Vicinamibacterales bacterium]|nr:TIGR00730 family Rossman fold protein [Vicinamibacterales bacterium]
MKRVCVFAGSSAGARPEYLAAAAGLGTLMAARDIELVYGGARVGLMGAIADAVLAGDGSVIGVIPRALVEKEVAHDGLTDLRIVTSMHERKALMADLSDAFIALPGGWGTLDEMFEILTWAQLGLHRKPCGLLNVLGYFDRLLSFLDYTMEQGFVRREYSSLLAVSDGPATLLDTLQSQTPPVVEKWIDLAST